VINHDVEELKLTRTPAQARLASESVSPLLSLTGRARSRLDLRIRLTPRTCAGRSGPLYRDFKSVRASDSRARRSRGRADSEAGPPPGPASESEPGNPPPGLSGRRGTPSRMESR
jgi:hypothetical protein